MLPVPPSPKPTTSTEQMVRAILEGEIQRLLADSKEVQASGSVKPLDLQRLVESAISLRQLAPDDSAPESGYWTSEGLSLGELLLLQYTQGLLEASEGKQAPPEDPAVDFALKVLQSRNS